MDLLAAINSSVGTSSEYGSQLAQRRKTSQAEDGAEPRQPGLPPEAAQAPQAVAPAEASSPVWDEDYPPLTKKEATGVINEVVGQIGGAPPWKLAEVQPVATRSLVPTAYI